MTILYMSISTLLHFQEEWSLLFDLSVVSGVKQFIKVLGHFGLRLIITIHFRISLFKLFPAVAIYQGRGVQYFVQIQLPVRCSCSIASMSLSKTNSYRTLAVTSALRCQCEIFCYQLLKITAENAPESISERVKYRNLCYYIQKLNW